MRIWNSGLMLVVASALTLPFAGCTGKTTDMPAPAPAKGEAAHDDHAEGDHKGHDHAGHSHDELGPHGGHTMGVEPGHRHIEWVHLDDEATIQVFVGDEPESVTAVSMTIEIKDAEPKTVTLEPAADLGPGAYQVKSPELYVAIMMKEAAKVTVKLKSKDGEQTGQIIEHDHDH